LDKEEASRIRHSSNALSVQGGENVETPANPRVIELWGENSLSSDRGRKRVVRERAPPSCEKRDLENEPFLVQGFRRSVARCPEDAAAVQSRSAVAATCGKGRSGKGLAMALRKGTVTPFEPGKKNSRNPPVNFDFLTNGLEKNGEFKKKGVVNPSYFTPPPPRRFGGGKKNQRKLWRICSAVLSSRGGRPRG